ncbi:hypothetical protein LguiB_001864 [Lonicera macranthoides]
MLSREVKKRTNPMTLKYLNYVKRFRGIKINPLITKKEAIVKQEAKVEENSKFSTFINVYLGKIMAIGGDGIRHIDLGVFDEGNRAYFAKKLKAFMVKELELYSEKAELVIAIVEELKWKHRKAAILMKEEITKEENGADDNIKGTLGRKQYKLRKRIEV